MEDFLLDNAGLLTLLIFISMVILANLFYSKGRYLTNTYTIHLPINSGEHWPSPRIDAALERARFCNVRYDVNKRMYTAKSSIRSSAVGEQIEVKVIECQGRRQLRFTSKCSAPHKVLNWTKNRRNSHRFECMYYNVNL
jgi:hypothetical protein